MCSLLEVRNHCAAKQLYFWQMKGASGKHKHSIPAPRISAANSAHDLGLRRDSASQSQAELLLGWCDRKLRFFLVLWINFNNHHFVEKWRGHFMMCSLLMLNLPLEKSHRISEHKKACSDTEEDQRFPQAVPEVCGDFKLVPDCTAPVQHIPAFATPAVHMQWWFTEEELPSFLRKSLIDPHSKSNMQTEISSEETPPGRNHLQRMWVHLSAILFVFPYIFRRYLGFNSFFISGFNLNTSFYVRKS